VRSPGAAHVIDYTKENLADARHRYDLIIDIAGNPCARATAPHGQIIRFCCHTRAACSDGDAGVVACGRWRAYCHIGAPPS
jgi:hypothetical protein